MSERRTSSGPWAEGEDPAPDCYRVEWTSDTVAIVRHAPDHKTRRVCCKVSVTITDRDRAKAYDFEKQKGATAALSRALSVIEGKHKGK